MKNLYGEFVWWIGVIEDRNDPLKIGRVRCRIFGYHTEDKSQIPTNKLPWAIPLQTSNSPAISGLGLSPTGLVEGSHVLGFFQDGPSAQKPIILGSIAGIPEKKPSSNKGFSDPNGIYPKEINEPDTNRLAVNDSSKPHPILKLKSDDREQNIKSGSSNWSEPKSSYSAQYPKNHVFETEGGHIQEFDDTPNSERYHRYHPSGTFEEILPSGDRVYKIKGKDYEIIEQDGHLLIKGAKKTRIEGSDDVTVVGNQNVNIEGNQQVNITGNSNISVGGDASILSDGNLNLLSSGDMTINAGGVLTIDASTLFIA